jgi:surface carbohydrate biosynthesis protein
MLNELTHKKFRRPIILSIETKVREFPGKVLLSCFLAERGFTVLLSNNRRVKEAVKRDAWLFVDRNTFANRIPFFKKLTMRGVRIACLDEEGIVWANPGIYQKRLNGESMDMTSLFFTWGARQTALVEQARKKTKILETGNPRMDLLRPELREFYQQRADDLKDKYGDFIIVVSNFAWNNHYFVNEEKESPEAAYIDLLKRQGHILTTEDEQFHRENLVYKGMVFEKFQELVRSLSTRFPDLKIIVRPHPSENHETWKKSLTGLENVQVLFEGELEPWIIAARAVIHNSCTSGVLAALLNRTSIAYMPFNDVRFEHEMPNSVSAQAITIEEVADLIKKSPISQEVPALLKEYIAATQDEFAAERIANGIRAEYGTGSFEMLSILASRIKRAVKSILFKLRIVKRDVSADSDNFDDYNFRKSYKAQKFESTTANEVIDLINTYSRLLNRFEDITAQSLDDMIEIKRA